MSGQVRQLELRQFFFVIIDKSLILLLLLFLEYLICYRGHAHPDAINM